MNFSMFSRSHFRAFEMANIMSKKIRERKTEEEFAEAKPRSVCLISRNLNREESSPFVPDASNVPRNPETQTQQRVLKRSGSCGKLQRNIEIHLEKTCLDYYNLQVTEKVR